MFKFNLLAAINLLNFFGALDRLVDGADHVKGLFGERVVPAVKDLFEAGDGVFDLDVLPLIRSELLGHKEGLG